MMLIYSSGLLLSSLGNYFRVQKSHKAIHTTANLELHVLIGNRGRDSRHQQKLSSIEDTEELHVEGCVEFLF